MEGAQLEMLDERDCARAYIPVRGEELILGRDLFEQAGAPSDPTVSRRHARLYQESGELFVEDFGSRNGTYVNGTKVEGILRVRIGDFLELGVQRLRLVSREHEESEAEERYAHARLAATRAGAPERLRLVYELTHLATKAATPLEILRT